MRKTFTSKFLGLAFTSVLSVFSSVLFAQNQNALDFDGVDDYASNPNGSSLIANATNMSLTMWVYPRNPAPAFPDFDGFAGIRNNLDADFYILEYTSTSVEARFRNSSGVNFDIIHAGMQLNTWQHYALTYDGAMMRLYLNGQPADSIAANGTITNTAEAFYLGNLLYQGTNYYYNGKLDEVSLWNRTLQPAEINCIYHNGIDSADAALKLNYRFNQGVAGGNNAGINTANSTTIGGNAAMVNFALNGTGSNWVAGVNNAGAVINDTICQGQSYVFGSQTLTAAGTYTDHFPLTAGCDSIVTLHLYVSILDTTVNQFNNTLTSQLPLASYQWITCGGGPIPGATNASYTPTSNGSYAVIVTKNGCSDTSSCHLITTIGLNEYGVSLLTQLYPNPFHNQLTIKLKNMVNNLTISITDIQGKEVKKLFFVRQDSFRIDMSDLARGSYLMKMVSDESITTVKLLKE